jgi:hypothetical protein
VTVRRKSIHEGEITALEEEAKTKVGIIMVRQKSSNRRVPTTVVIVSLLSHS